MSEQHEMIVEELDNSDYLGTGCTKHEVITYLGKNAEYYIKKWEASEAPEKKAGWNLAAVLASGFWLGYRKMYKIMMGMFAAFLVFDIVQFFLNVDLNNAIGVSISAVLGILGNSLYFQCIKKDLAVLKEQNGGVIPEEVLAKAGGTSWKGVGMTVLMFVAYLVVLIIFETILG